MAQHLQFCLCKFGAFCHTNLDGRRRVRKDVFPCHCLSDNLHEPGLVRILIPEAVSTGCFCLIQNRTIDQ